MKVALIFGLVFFIAVATNAVDARCHKPCFTTLEVDRVCGSDGVTYINPGALACEQMCNKDLVVRKKGSCSD
ncbi:unnamed protein product [Allacma fusca]|uniref:Kazal-like domain-containing protein n=1 Tax=Allacma fusca TaxID=39272 RepID=A0A8J2LIW1_9HEXA|nr:unnamed protein product [Allacma fusca]